MVRLSAWSQQHRWLALAIWVVVLVGISGAAQAEGTSYRNDIALPGTQSQQVLDELHADAPQQAGESIQVVVHDTAGLTPAPTTLRVRALLGRVQNLPHVLAVSDPFTTPGALSGDETTAYSTVQLDGVTADIPPAAIASIISTAKAGEGHGLQVELGGDAIRSAQGGGGGPAEGLGLLAALVILLVMFGSLLAATLPLITAAFAVGSTLGIIALLSNILTIPDYAAPLMILVGLGVGIDYALLIFSRFRSELLAGHERAAATNRALDTAGRSVLFAGATVMIALLGLLTLRLSSLEGVALAVALTVLATMITSLTLLPSLLSIFGGRIEKRIRRHHERARGDQGRRWRSWASRVQRRPVAALVLGLVVTGAMAVPALSMRLGIADAGTDPVGTTSRAAYDLLAKGFGPGFNGPLVVIAKGGSTPAADLRQALSAVAGVAFVNQPQALATGGGYLAFVVPASAPQAAATTDLVATLRTVTLPELARTTGATYLVGGTPAAAGDFAAAVSARLPWFIGAVVGLSALLLMAVFRSVLIPVKAAILNILSIGASLGIVTLVFQRGLFGVDPGPVQAFVPVMIFAIVFGLSMDYEVFLVSRMHEEWEHTTDPHQAVRHGLAATGGVVTAAAAIMFVVFGAFLLSPGRMLQQFGLGLAVAVLVDALIIRCLLLPAIMTLLGRRAWWLPQSVGRLIPTIPLEGRPTPPSNEIPS
ncbi:MAG: MMPL family transporter [Humibacillus sp.]|nr:MMPL family transporter [Humibacillus sp.]MDN5777358.1 MMPL family transporter [Humibacillus sp.]